MNTLPKALYFLEMLEVSDKHPELINVNNRAAAELRRLHEVNAELVEALVDMVEASKKSNGAKSFTELGAIGRASAVIAKATGEQP